MLQWYRDLIALRRREFQLADGRLDLVEVDFDETANWLVMRRGDLRTVVNFDGSRWRVPLDARPLEVVLAWDPAQTRLQNQGLHLPPQSAAIVRIDAGRGMG